MSISHSILFSAAQSKQRAVHSTEETETMSQSNGLITGPPATLRAPINVPNKLLMGPGPTNISPRVAQACSLQLGHMHSEMFKVMDEIKEGMRYVFQTQNPWTLVVSGPGHLGMEAVLVNLLEPGETVLIGVTVRIFIHSFQHHVIAHFHQAKL